MEKRIMLAAALLLTAALSAASPAEKELLLGADFETGYDAAYSRGSGRAVLPESLRRIPAAGALALPPNGWFCYPAPGNISLDEGTIQLEITPDFTPGEGKLPSGWHDAQLFCIRNRIGHRLNGVVNNKTGMLHFSTSDGSGKSTTVKVPVKGWKRGETRTVAFAWKKPGTASVAVQGFGKRQIRNARLPECPVEFLYDIYFGSNAQVLPVQQYGKLGTFPGKIGGIRIYGKFHPEAPGELPELKRHNSAPAWPDDIPEDRTWVGTNRRRINFFLNAPKREWKYNPVKLDLDLSGAFASLSGVERFRAVNGLRLVASDPVTGKPLVYDAKKSGDERFFRPFQLSPGFFGRGDGEIAFIHSGAFPVVYSVYFDRDTAYTEPFPAEYPPVGVGYPVMLGTKEHPEQFGGGLRGAFALHDFDGDGAPDLLFLSGNQTDSGRDLWSGLYFHRNLRKTFGFDCFGPPELVDKGNNPFGHFRQTAPPRLVDLDGDGEPELAFASQSMCAYAKLELRNGTPRPYGWKELKFTKKRPGLVSSALFHDFNGDGLADLFSDGECYLNVGTKAEPLFSSEALDLFVPGVRGEAETSTHRDVHAQKIIRNAKGENIRPLVWEIADVNGDGRQDLICGGWTSQLYFFPCQADGRFGKPELLLTADGAPVEFPGVFPFPYFCDLDGSGSSDLLLSSEDGTLGICRNRAKPGEPLRLDPPEFLRGLESPVNAGALAIPVAFDWDGDGDLDLLAGAANGRIYLFENSGTAEHPRYSGPAALKADGREIRLQAGPLGSVQGDQESDWGYVNIEVADWDLDGLPDLIATGVRGDHSFFRNSGTRREPELTFAGLIEVDYPGETPYPPNIRFRPKGRELLTVHRCRPTVIDWNRDGLPDYLTTDHNDRLAFYERYRRPDGTLGLKPGRNIFKLEAPFFRALIWNHQSVMGIPTRSAQEGRSVTQFIDWDRDGKIDLLMDNINARFLKNSSSDLASPVFTDSGDLAAERLANHNAAPCAADFDGDGVLDLFVGTEAGTIHAFSRPYLEKDMPRAIRGSVQEKQP